jgi:hypothetical protein
MSGEKKRDLHLFRSFKEAKCEVIYCVIKWMTREMRRKRSSTALSVSSSPFSANTCCFFSSFFHPLEKNYLVLRNQKVKKTQILKTKNPFTPLFFFLRVCVCPPFSLFFFR